MTFESGIREQASEAPPEAIRSAAVLYKNEIFTGVIHSDALEAMKQVHPQMIREDEYKNGYVTTTGRFADRMEAGLIAEQNDQIRESAKKRWSSGRGLWTEDLKPEVIYPNKGEAVKGEN